MAGYRDVPFQHVLNDAMNFRIVETPPVFQDGYIQVSENPGLGLGQFVPGVIKELESLEPA